MLFGCASSPNQVRIVPISPEEIPALIATHSSDSLLVINIWATWCIPCIEEFPDFLRVQNQFAKEPVTFKFISVDFSDQTESILKFLQKTSFQGTMYHKSGSDEAFINQFSSDWDGSIPVTFIFRRDSLLHTFHGKTTQQQLMEKITEYNQRRIL